MGRYAFKLPDVGEGTAEAEIAAWHVEIGSIVEEDGPLVDVMTDKATIEITSPVAGKVIARTGNAGDMAPVGSIIVEFEVEGEGNVAAGAAAPAAAAAAAAKVEDPTETPSPAQQAARVIDVPDHTPAPAPAKPAAKSETTATFATRVPDARPLAPPAVRARAHELGIELQYVPGSGPGGRISHADLDTYVDGRRSSKGGASSGGSRLTQRHGADEVKVIGLRRKIAERMQDAKRRIPHFMYAEELDVTELEDLRAFLNAQNKGKDRPKLTLLPFLMRAMANVLPSYPQLNARYDDEAGIVHRHHAIHIGIATQTASGLAVPVVRHVEARDIYDCAGELSRVAQATRDGKATRDELSGSTITISSLGPMGGIVSTPVINSPEVGIIAVNKIAERPVVKNGQIVVRKMMNLSSSFDHRVVDGWDAAEFIQRLKAVLETPASIFMDD